MKIAIAGLGTVGAGVIKLLAENSAEIKARSNAEFEVIAVSAQNKYKDRGVDLSGIKWCDNPLELAESAADVIIELIGGEAGVALELTKKALAAKKHVITANKAMLAHHGGELAELAESNGVQLRYEAAVAGGIPVIKVLREGLAGNKITRVLGILNGTSNYILTEMEAQRKEFAEVLGEAQAKGYAEADPAFDIGGIDAAHKLALLVANAFGVRPDFAALQVEGIDKVMLADIDFAKKLGYRIKHICFADATAQRATACLLPVAHPLAYVDGVFNAVEIDAEPVGQFVLKGRGAGAGPTASAVVADLIDIANGRFVHTFNVPVAELGVREVAAVGEDSSEYYLRLTVVDKAGVLEEITAAFRDAQISIYKFLQDEVSAGQAQIVIVTHVVVEKTLKAAVVKLQLLESVREEIKVIRILNN